MLFEIKGKICDNQTLHLSWYKKNSMVPLPYLLTDRIIRIFFTMCDEKNIGRIGYIDVDHDNPEKILDYSKDPILDIGKNGTFDDNGVVTSSLFEEDGKLYLFYSGYELCVKIPYRIFCGVAVSHDHGKSFHKISNASILPPIHEECYNRCAPYVTKEENGDSYRVFYLGDVNNQWLTDENGKLVPFYTLKTFSTSKLFQYDFKKGDVVMPFLSQDECGITLPNIWKDDGMYKMIYSIRNIKSGYKLGYAESEDGIHFCRDDGRLNFVRQQNSEWDNEMMCFAQLLKTSDKTYLFYSGNHYGMGGIGFAELLKE